MTAEQTYDLARTSPGEAADVALELQRLGDAVPEGYNVSADEFQTGEQQIISGFEREVDRLRSALTETERQRHEGFREAVSLAKILHRRFYADNPQWRPLDTAAGVISQIDNMIAGLASRLDEAEAALAATVEEDCLYWQHQINTLDRLAAAPSDTSSPTPAQEGWRPIETAPKTKTDDMRAVPVLAWCPDEDAVIGGDVRIVWWEPKLKGGCWWSDRDMREEPTHWWTGKLPPPPTPDPSAGEGR